MSPVPINQPRNRDQVHAACRKSWQQLFQRVQGFDVRMADADGETPPLGERHQPLELPRDVIALRRVIQKHVPLQVRNPVSSRHALSDGFTGGSAVEKVKVAPGFDGLHEPTHGLGLSGQQAAHVIADSRDVGNGRQVRIHRLDELLSRHALGKTARAQPSPGD